MDTATAITAPTRADWVACPVCGDLSSSLYVGAAASIGQELIQPSDDRYLGFQYRWGPQAEAVVGAEVLEDRRVNVFFEASVIAPLLPVVTSNSATNQDDSLWAPTLQLAMGVVF